MTTTKACDHIWCTHNSNFAPVYNGEDLHLYLDMSGSIFYINEGFSFIESVVKEYIKIAQDFGVRLFVTEFSHIIEEDQEIDVTAYGGDVDKILEYYMEHQFKGLYGGTYLGLVINHITEDSERTNNQFSIIVTDYILDFFTMKDELENMPEKLFYESYKELRDTKDTVHFRNEFIADMEQHIKGYRWHCGQ